MKILRSFVAVAFAACSAAPAVDPNNDAIARVEAGLRPSIAVKGAAPVTYTLSERMARYKVPGISVAVVNGGRIAWARGYGLKEANTTDSVTPTTLFQAASISKPVAATAMLRLVDKGTLSLDVPINDYLKSWKLPDNAFTASKKVTLRRIASHSAGLTVHGFPGYAEGDSVPTVPQILDGAKPANTRPVRVDTTPGAIWRYSGGGTTIAQLAMMDATGEDFPSLVRRLVLDPAGMKNSTYQQPLPASLRAQAAAGHGGNGTMVKGRWHTYPEMAAAGLWTTPTDLLQWAMEVTAARAGKSTKVLSQKTATEMLTVQKGVAGIGPMLHNTGRAFYFEHGGANEGYRCQVLYFPETGQGAAVMTNSDAGGSLAQEMLYALAAEYQWPEYGPRQIEPVAMDSAMIAQLVGDYPVPREATGSATPVFLQIRQEGSRLTVEVPPGYVAKGELLQLAGNQLISPESGFEIGMERDASGTVSGLRVGPTVLKRR